MHENQNQDSARWGRPLRKRSRGPKSQPAPNEPAFVGPVDPEMAHDAAIVSPAAHRASAPPLQEPDASDQLLRDLVAHLARGIVDHPEDVSVDILRAGEDAEFELRVHPDDLGHVIGKQGRTARSLRLTLGAAAARLDRDAGLEIAD